MPRILAQERLRTVNTRHTPSILWAHSVLKSELVWLAAGLPQAGFSGPRPLSANISSHLKTEGKGSFGTLTFISCVSAVPLCS